MVAVVSLTSLEHDYHSRAGPGSPRTVPSQKRSLRRDSPAGYPGLRRRCRLSKTLTEHERYLRFFTMHPGYLDEWVRSLTEQREDLFAIGAFDDGALIGIANYALTRTAGCAEIAVLVAHDQHERGVGTALLQSLAHAAVANGLHYFVADVLAENYLMLKVISDVGWPCTRHLDSAVFRIEFDLANLDGGKPRIIERPQ